MGGNELPNEISIYPVDLTSKTKIENVLDAYNVGKSSSEMVTYTDLSQLISETLGSLVNVVTWVLIGFTAIRSSLQS